MFFCWILRYEIIAQGLEMPASCNVFLLQSQSTLARLQKQRVFVSARMPASTPRRSRGAGLDHFPDGNERLSTRIQLWQGVDADDGKVIRNLQRLFLHYIRIVQRPLVTVKLVVDSTIGSGG